MSNLKLTIDLLPKGAWGNNLSSILPKKDWDTLRNFCYEKAKHKCAICGSNGELDAHEIWDFDIESKTQTLKNIVALCSACHGVKHFRNSTRIGYGESAKAHFLKINKCNPLNFASHYTEAQLLFEERNKVLRWKLNVSLDRFGGKGIAVVERDIPLIKNIYDEIDWNKIKTQDVFKVVYNKENANPNVLSPKIRSLKVDNYEGTITLIADYANKIQWIYDDMIIKTKYNIIGKFITKFSVEDLEFPEIYFVLSGDGGQVYSQPFKLIDAGIV